MSLLQSIFMGLIQGLTEFLPVSSSGHLAIFQYIFKMNTDTGMLFEVMLHLGTLVAVCVIFFKDIKNLVVNGIKLLVDVCSNIGTFFSNKFKKTNKKYRRLIDNAYKKFVVLIIVTTIPTGIIGILFSTFIANASASLLVPGICLVVTAILLLLADGKEGGKKKVKATSYKDAGIVGLAQGIATLPGLSRSGTTITTCLFLGFDRSFAVKYSCDSRSEYSGIEAYWQGGFLRRQCPLLSRWNDCGRLGWIHLYQSDDVYCEEEQV